MSPRDNDQSTMADQNEVLTRSARRGLLRQCAPGWRTGAVCASVDPDAWFPDEGETVDRRVLALCAGCPVRRSCLATALYWRDLGVWAGTTETTRRRGYRMLRADTPAAKVLDLLLDAATRKATKPRRRRGNPGPALTERPSARSTPHEHLDARWDSGGHPGRGPGVRGQAGRLRAAGPSHCDGPGDGRVDDCADPVRVDPGVAVSAVCGEGASVADAAVRRGLASRGGPAAA